ncbi:MAG: succinate dehydrogenase cytochrome b subunit [Planctomycetota bacterium]|jgi:succinate dehydrogenase / fumarate reductase cytochrome b subunit
MSSLAPSKREHPTNTLPSRGGLWAWLAPLVTSTIGSKVIVALTGSMLLGFVVAHMLGNLQIFQGADKLNEYALFLKKTGPLLWVARIGLLAVLLTHMLVSLSLKKRSVDARPIGYAHENTIQATFASLTMVQTGLLIFLFILYHLAHFTLGWTQTAGGENFLAMHDEQGRHNVYGMIIAGFSSTPISLIYIAAQAVLFIHLSHGVSSVFQTLGLNTPRTAGLFRWLGYAVAGVIFVGNCSIVVAVWRGWIS